MKALLPDFYTFTGLMVGRVYMSDDADGVTLIDTGLELAAERILKQLSAAGRKPSDVKRILITHAHPDHIGGLPKLKEATGAEVICSVGERPVIEGKIPIPRAPRERVPGIWRYVKLPVQTIQGTPVDRELMEGDVLPEVMGGLHVISTPGHAPDHISFWQPDRKVLIIGDVIMKFFGRMRLPLAVVTVDMDEDKRSIKKLTEYDAQVVCFGHGEPFTKNGAEKIHAFARRVGVI
jgi:glyoxylase-like metal-dependent hydrolase (beta-lactamase superfamily II)